MRDQLGCWIEQLRSFLAAFDPTDINGEEAAQLLRLFGEGERLCGAGKTLAAERVSATEVWRRGGARSAADWVAHETGTETRRASAVLETASGLAGCSLVESGLRAGQLSEAQAHAIVDAVATRPDAEERLVAYAGDHTVRQLNDECRRVKAGAESEDDRDRLRKSRSFRHWTGRDGAMCFSGRLTPDSGAEFITAIEARKAKILCAAQRGREREPFEAYAADALVALVTEERTGTPGRSQPRATVIVHVAYEALARGRLLDGEVCEITGVGPVSLDVAQQLAGDSILRVLVTKGGVPIAVTPGKRTIPPALRTLLDGRDRECVIPGCDVTLGLQIDHRRPFSVRGPTTPENCSKLCRRHHDMKTYAGWSLGGGPGAWTWTPPDGYLDPEPPDRDVGTLLFTDPWSGRVCGSAQLDLLETAAADAYG